MEPIKTNGPTGVAGESPENGHEERDWIWKRAKSAWGVQDAAASATHDAERSSRSEETARRLVRIGRRLDARGWVLGTSGNLSAVLGRDPLRLAMTPSAAAKGELTPEQILEVDENGTVVAGSPAAKPSAECLLHVAVVRSRAAGAVLHTHSLWGTLVSDRAADAGGLVIEGYEMLKGLDGVRTHQHREWIPVLDNDQDMPRLAASVSRTLREHPDAHGFLLRRHGLYTWGRNLAEATRHVEILEFLLEAVGRTGSTNDQTTR